MDTMSYLLGKKASGGGGSTGSDIFVVTGSAESPIEPPTIDKNIDEILSAYTSGKVVIFNGPFFATFLSLGYDDGGEHMKGDYFEVDMLGKLVHTHIKINSNGYSDTVNQYKLTKSS